MAQKINNVLAALSWCAAAQLSHAGIAAIEGNATLIQYANIIDGGPDGNDEDFDYFATLFDGSFPPGGQNWSTNLSTQAQQGDITASITSSSNSFASSDTFSFESFASASWQGDTLSRLSGGYDLDSNFSIRFDGQPTEVDILIRVVTEGPTDADVLFANVGLFNADLNNPTILSYDKAEGDPVGTQVFSIRTTISDARTLILDFNARAEFSPNDDLDREVGRIGIFASVTVVPTPGVMTLFGISGLIAARRRR